MSGGSVRLGPTVGHVPMRGLYLCLQCTKCTCASKFVHSPFRMVEEERMKPLMREGTSLSTQSWLALAALHEDLNGEPGPGALLTILAKANAAKRPTG